MTLDEAIKHCLEVAEQNETQADKWQEEGGEQWGKTIACRECAADHRQLAEWLKELKEISLQIAAPRLGSIEEYHYELARCKAAFWSCNKRCMDAEEQYRRKADELRKAQEQIAEYKRLLKAAVEDLSCGGENNKCTKSCKTCTYNSIKGYGCRYFGEYHWRYAAEALALIGEDGDTNG